MGRSADAGGPGFYAAAADNATRLSREDGAGRKKKKKGGNRCDADFGAHVPFAVRHRWEDEPRTEAGEPALRERVQGTVRLEAIVDERGTVTDVCVSKGHWFFEQSAINAVRQWKFTPTLLDGKPVPLVMAVEVDFFIR